MINRLVSGSILALLFVASAFSASPTLKSVTPRGLQTGTVTTLTVRGSGLQQGVTLATPFGIRKQTVQSGATPDSVKIDVELSAEISPGIYMIRVVTPAGISNPLPVTIDATPPQPFADRIESLPVAMDGELTGANILRTSFSGKEGQKIVVELLSRRLGSQLKPILRLLDDRGGQIAWSPPQAQLKGDAHCQATLPQDGEYTIELHDLLYRGAAPGQFRLQVGELKYAHAVYPLAVQKGQTVSVQPKNSNLPTDTTAEVTGGDTPFVVSAVAKLPAALSAPAPELTVTDAPQVREEETSSDKAIGNAPIGISGVLAKSREEDRYRLNVTPGQKLAIDLDHALFDGYIALLGEKGNVIAQNDDRPGAKNSRLEYVVPKNAKVVLVSVRDLHRGGGEDYVYHLRITDLNTPDFSLQLNTDRLEMPKNQPSVVRVVATRRGYQGPIQLGLQNLPEDVIVEGDVIPPGANATLLTLTPNMKAALRGGITRLAGWPIDNVKQSRLATTPLTATALTTNAGAEIGWAVTTARPTSIELASDVSSIRRGGTISVPIKINGSVKTPIRFRLLSSHVAPMKTVKKDNKDVSVEDPDRSLQLVAAVTAPTGATEATVNIAAGALLPIREHHITVVAEQLSADGKRVVSTTYAVPAALKATPGLQLKLNGKPNVNALAGEGETGKLAGTVNRNGITGPITLKLNGLPKEYPSEDVTLTAKQSDFEFPVRFAKGAKPQDLKAQLIAISQIGDRPEGKTESNKIEIAIKVTAGK